MKWVYQALAINEFNDRPVVVNDAPSGILVDGQCNTAFPTVVCIDGTTYLNQNFNNGHDLTVSEWEWIMWRYLIFIASFISLFHILACFVLYVKGPKYLKMNSLASTDHISSDHSSAR